MFGVHQVARSSSAGDLEIVPYVQPMPAYGVDLSIFVTRGRIYGHFDRRRADTTVVNTLLKSFVDRLLRI
jgi:hypothetical protein